jgi:glycosyltransferase involved in cell wall biosynthesis
MPHVEIHVFGPLQTESIAELGLLSSNITYRGQIESIFEMDYSRYSAFIFTSKTEGNPLIVLEMAALGLPIVSTKVGDLSSTFSDNEIDFVDPSLSAEGQAREFVEYLSAISRLASVDREVRVERAASAVKRKHSEKAVMSEIRRIFEINT